MNKTNIFILHSLNGDTLEIWGKDIKEKFEAKGISVTMPNFPIRAESRYVKFKEILLPYLENNSLNNNTLVVAHSIGNAYFTRFAKETNFIPKAYIAVAPGAVYEYPSNRNDYIVEVKKQSYVTSDVFEYVKNNITNKYCFYSDEDDNNLEKFSRFINDTGAKGIYLENYNHFDGYHNIKQIPELVDLINELIK